MITTLKDHLLELYGPRGWWPISLFKPFPENPYHLGDYNYPKNDNQRFEISVGAILTQNTSWTNVTKALASLFESANFSPSAIQKLPQEQLGKIIKSAGYFNQKAGYLQNFCSFLEQHSYCDLLVMPTLEARQLLLGVKGIGEETADCILLYALGHVTFVVDAYTKRFLISLGLIQKNAKYNEIQTFLLGSLPYSLTLFQEFHALFVEHGKKYYSKKPYGRGDPLLHLAKNNSI